MRYERIPSGLFVRNRGRLRALLKPNSAVILHGNDVYPTSADGTLPFKQGADIYYLTGVAQEETILLLVPEAPEAKNREILFVKETNEHIAIWEGEKLGKQDATQVSGIARVEWLGNFESCLHQLIPQVENIYLATNEHLRAASIVETRNARFIKECQARFPLHRYERLAPLMHQLRMIKDAEEVRLTQHACDITEAGFRRVLGFLKPGVTEWEIEAEFLHEFIRRGSRGFAYSPIIGGGKNACVLHYTQNDQICREGEMVLMDVAAEWVGWNADMTRSLPVSGRFSARQRAVYQSVLSVMRGANNLLYPGNNPTDYQTAVLELMERELVNLGLFTAAEAKAQGPEKPLVRKYFMHGTSHHLGLDIHDVSPPYQPFVEGMILTIEPGIYIREEGLGIRLENNVVIGKSGNFDLMRNIPLELEEIEDLMNA